MKKTLHFLNALSIILAITICNTGCSKNDDTPSTLPQAKDIEGSWAMGHDVVYTFNSDNSCLLYGVNLSKAVDASVYYAGRWALNNENLTIVIASYVADNLTEDYNATLLYQITGYGNGTLVLKDVQTNVTLTGTPTSSPVRPETPPTEDDWTGTWLEWPFAKGADVSWVTQMEDEGITFHHNQANGGSEGELMEILKVDCGVNAIRLRVWVNPGPMKVGGKVYSDLADVIVKAQRANDLGLELMIDFHFSDYWTDPGKQWMPAAWKGLTVDEIKNAITEHVTATLTALKAVGVNPKWVQLGNEVTWGMLWDPAYGKDNQSGSTISGQPNGNDFSTTQAKNFSSYVQTAYNAVKAVDASICTIVHITDAYKCYWDDSGAWIFNILEANKVEYDMIGLSLYPTQATDDSGKYIYKKAELMSNYVNPSIVNAKKLTGRYGRPVMFVEVGMPWDDPESGAQLLQAILDAAKTDVNLRGVFWWEPQANPYWEAEGNGSNGYTLGGFNPYDNSPTTALSPFLTNMN